MAVRAALDAYRMVDSSTRIQEQELTILGAYSKFAREYIWAHGYTKSTADNYLLATKSLIRTVTNKPLSQVTIEDIYQWREAMERQNMAANAINKYLYSVRLMFRYLNKYVELSLDPDGIIIPKYRQQLPKYLTKEEVDKLIEVADPRGKALIGLMYSSGMRVGEIVSLRRRDINGDSIKIRGKGDKERIAFIDPRAQDYLQRYLKSRTDCCPFLFHSKKGGGLGKGMVQRIVKELAEQAGLDKIVTPHVIRHSFATHMAQAGIGTFHLQKLLGHSHISTTQIYVHLTGQDVRKAYQKYH